MASITSDLCDKLINGEVFRQSGQGPGCDQSLAPPPGGVRSSTSASYRPAQSESFVSARAASRLG